MTWKALPSVTSDALIGVPDGSRVRRMPLAHMVCDRSSAGSTPCGARPRKRMIPGSGKAISAPMRLLRISTRRLKPDSSSAWRKISAARSVVPSLPRTGWRRSTPSFSCMSALPQWTAPMPMARSARALPIPMNRLFRRTEPGSLALIGNAM